MPHKLPLMEDTSASLSTEKGTIRAQCHSLEEAGQESVELLSVGDEVRSHLQLLDQLIDGPCVGTWRTGRHR